MALSIRSCSALLVYHPPTHLSPNPLTSTIPLGIDRPATCDLHRSFSEADILQACQPVVLKNPGHQCWIHTAINIDYIYLCKRNTKSLDIFFFFFFFYFEYLPWADFSVLYKVPVFRSTQHLQIIYFQYLNIRWRNDLYVIHIFVILMCGYC